MAGDETMRRWVYWALTVAALSACSPAGNAINPEEDAKEAVRQQKDCADPQWKAAHLGVWYSVCRPNGAVR